MWVKDQVPKPSNVLDTGLEYQNKRCSEKQTDTDIVWRAVEASVKLI
jgi:hypothetical protein